MDYGSLRDVCGPSACKQYALSASGHLYYLDGAKWKQYDFNMVYYRYYSSCIFTALIYANELLYLAGLDEGGRPHLFTSLLGSVWEEHALIMYNPLEGTRQAEGRVQRILWDSQRKQIFLACANGQLITVPDCPKCVKIRQVTNEVILDAAIQGEEIVLITEENKVHKVTLDEVVQFRISYSYAKEKLEQGALLVDLRSASEYAEDGFSMSLNISIEEVPGWLKAQSREVCILFLCRFGFQADMATKMARQCGFANSYSMGGTLDVAHLE